MPRTHDPGVDLATYCPRAARRRGRDQRGGRDGPQDHRVAPRQRV